MEKKIIVVPVDFTSATTNALKYGIALASAMENEIVALHILEDEAKRVEKDIEMKDLLESMAENTEVHISYKVIEGDPKEDIAKVAEAMDATLVLMGSHGHSAMQNIIGSGAMRVIRDSHVPFLVIQEFTPYRQIKKIGMSIDLHKESIQVVKAVATIAECTGAEVQLIAGRQTQEDCARLEDNNMSVARNYLIEHGIEPSEVLIMKDHYKDRLVEFCHDNEFDLIAASYHPEAITLFSDKFVQNLIQNNFRIPVLTLESEPVGIGSSLDFLPV